MSVDWKTTALPERVSAADRAALIAFLTESIGTPVRVSVRALRRHDTLLYQALLAASRQWRSKGVPFEVEFSDRLERGLDRLGLTADLLDRQVAA